MFIKPGIKFLELRLEVFRSCKPAKNISYYYRKCSRKVCMILVSLPYLEHPVHFLRAGERVSWSFSGWLMHWGIGGSVGVVRAICNRKYLTEPNRRDFQYAAEKKWHKSIIKEVMTKINEEKFFGVIHVESPWKYNVWRCVNYAHPHVYASKISCAKGQICISI